MSRAKRLVEAAINSPTLRDLNCDFLSNDNPNLEIFEKDGKQNMLKEDVPSTSKGHNNIVNYEVPQSFPLQSPSIFVHTENSDIIEPSEEETLNSNLSLKQLYSKSCVYANLNNVSPFKFDENEHENIDGPDFSSGSDEVYIPESYLSDTDLSVGDNFIADTNHSPSRASVTLQNSERNVVEEVPVTSHKRKQFPPKENKSKKRPRNETKWKKKTAALAREKGDEYLSYKNTVKPRKTIKEGVLCHENCRMDCSSKFNREERQSILEDFYKLDVNGKNALLFSSIVSKPVSRRRTNAKKNKSATYKYFIKQRSLTTEVCKLGLCGLYQISRKKVDIIIQKIKSGASAPLPDRRGRHDNRPHKIAEEVTQHNA